MSMIARFVAIPPDQLNEIKASPDRVGELFGAGQALAGFDLLPALRERMRSQSPQMLKGMLERMPPDMRERIVKSFGVSESELASPNVGDAIMKRMDERLAKLRQTLPRAQKSAPKGISIDKAWHGLHYLLCGAAEPTSDPLGQAVLGGHEIGEDLGYGPARYFTRKEVAEIAAALESPGLEANLRARFVPAAMLSVDLYPGGWDTAGVDWLVDAFQALRDFYVAASASGQAAVAVIE